MPKEPLVTIIMPVFNSANTLQRAIDSVLSQDHTHLELLIIDNNSSDESKQIAFSCSDPRVKVLEELKQGVSAARNIGLGEAKGELICFLDSDDEFPPKSISSRVSIMNDSEVNFVDGSVEFRGSKRPTWTPKNDGELLKGLVKLNGNCFCGITWMIRKNVVESTRFSENMTHSEDLLFLITMAQKGGKYAFSDQITYRVHTVEGSLMSNLIGLKDGYLQTSKSLQKLNIEPAWLADFKKKARSIMIKSFLKDGQLREAWKTYLTFLLD